MSGAAATRTGAAPTGAADAHAADIATLRGHFRLDDSPDLARTCADGFEVLAWYRPSIERARDADARATIEVRRYGAAIDALDVPARDALTVWRHAATYSEVYAGELTRRPDAETCEVAP